MDFGERLIEEVRKHNILYDTSSNDYKNIMKKEMIWEEIGRILISNAEACKKRWRSLRDTYRKIKSHEVTRSGSEACGTNKWKHYEAMRFLDNIRTTRPTIGNIKTCEEDILENSCDAMTSSFNENTTNTTDLFDESISFAPSSCKRKKEDFMKMDFGEKLIEEVRKNSILYDTSSDDYKNVIKKEMIWEEIGKSLISNAESCKKRWKSLRDTYRKIKSNEVTRSGSEAAGSIKLWKHYEAMRFLDNIATTRPTIGSIKEEEEDNLENSDDPLASSFNENTSNTTDLLDESVSSASPSCKRKKDVHDKFSNFLKIASNSISETLKTEGEAREEEDSTSLLFKSLALKIRKANLSEAELNDIEQSIFSVAYHKLTSFQQKRNQ